MPKVSACCILFVIVFIIFEISMYIVTAMYFRSLVIALIHLNYPWTHAVCLTQTAFFMLWVESRRTVEI